MTSITTDRQMLEEAREEEDIFLVCFRFFDISKPPQSPFERLIRFWLRDFWTGERLPYTVQCCWVKKIPDGDGNFTYECFENYRCTSEYGVEVQTGRCFSDKDNWQFFRLALTRSQLADVQNFFATHAQQETGYSTRKRNTNYVLLFRMLQKGFPIFPLPDDDKDPQSAEQLTCVSSVVLALASCYPPVLQVDDPDSVSPWYLWKLLKKANKEMPLKVQRVHSEQLWQALSSAQLASSGIPQGMEDL